MLKIHNLNKKFNEKIILDNASMEIGENEIVSITGESGEGKSTIARIICGTIKADSGEIKFKNEDLLLSFGKYNSKFRHDIQLIPQQPFLALDQKQTVGDAVAEPLLFHKIAKNYQEAKTMALDLFSQVDLPHELFSRFPWQISGGQAQRVVIARSLTLSPKLLISDESTSMLDTSTQFQILKIYCKLVEEKKLSLLLITHDLDLAHGISHKVFTVSKGNLSLK